MARNLYAADLAEASTALSKGDLGHARALLSRYINESQQSQAITSDTRLDFTGRLLWKRCQGQEVATLGTHSWIVTCVAVSPDGRWAASGSQALPRSETNSLKVWSLEPADSSTGTSFRFSETPLPSLQTIWSVGFTQDSGTLVSAGAEGLRFWNVTNGRPRNEIVTPFAQEFGLAGNQLVGSPNHPFFSASNVEPLWHLNLATGKVRTLAARGRHPNVSPDGRRLAYLDEQVRFQLIDLETEKFLFTLETNRLFFRVKFSPDGQRLVISGQATAARMWDLAEPGTRPLAFPSEHNVWDAAFTPDGESLVTANSHQQVEIWNARTAERQHTWIGHENEVWTVAPLPDGKQVLSGSKDRSVRLWSLRKPPPEPRLAQWRYAKPVFSPDGSRLLTCSHFLGKARTAVWRLPDQRSQSSSGELTDAPYNLRPTPLGTRPEYPRGFAPDGKSILHLISNPTRVEWWDHETGLVIRQFELPQAPANLRLNEFALAGDARSFVVLDGIGDVWRWSTEEARSLGRIKIPALAKSIQTAAGGPRPGKLVRCLRLSQSGRWLALGSFSGTSGLLLDTASGVLRELIGHRDDISAFAFSPDSQLLASASVDGTIRLWDITTGRSAGEMAGHFEAISAIDFSPDGRTLVSMNEGIDLSFWHVATQRKLAHFAHPLAGYHLTFSPDGQRLAVGTLAAESTEPDLVEIWEVMPLQGRVMNH